ncbi:MAG: hypothetical protein WBS14_08300, partial [Rhodomicrobium sp.]
VIIVVNELYFWTQVGSQKSVKYVSASEINAARSRKSCGAGTATASRTVFFLIFIKGLGELMPR